MIDVDSVLATLEKPVLRIHGRTWEGRLLSHAEFQPFRDRIARLLPGIPVAERLTDEEAHALVHEFLRALFPLRWRMIWRGDPVQRLLRAPPAVLGEVVQRFFICQLQAMAPPGATTPTPGPSSKP